MNKSAKEMFEELGYECVMDDKTKVMYVIKEIPYCSFFIFWKNCKNISHKKMSDDTLYLQELQAINKQVEELGWNNE